MEALKSSPQRPDANTPDIENYQIFSRVEILALLRAIREQRVLMTLYLSGGEESFVTTLLAVNPEFEELVFDASTDSAQSQRILASSGLVVVAFVDRVKVQFSTKRAEKTVQDGQDALRVRMPDSVFRLQRRDNYRAETPVARPVKCSIASPVPNAPRIELTVVDISCGGISVMVDPELLVAQSRQLLKDFVLDLGEIGVVKGALEVRHISDESRGVARRDRLGCAFARMPGTMGTLIQRYVTHLERERLIRR